jgi:membrane glycosyltransferase
MLLHSRAVFEVLSGRDSGWSAQQRDGAVFSLRDAWTAHRWHMLAGVLCGAAAFAFDPAFFWWTLPVTLGLVLAAPLSALSARADLGRAARRLGLLLTPEEARPPHVVRRAALLRVLNGMDVDASRPNPAPASNAMAA